MMDEVEVPGGYANARGILLYIPDPRTDRRTLYIFKREHNTRKSSSRHSQPSHACGLFGVSSPDCLRRMGYL